MRIVLDMGAGPRELAIAIEAADATLAELLATAGCEPVAAVYVDGRRVPTGHTVAEAAIPDGATVRSSPPRPPRSDRAGRTATPRLAVVVGAAAGAAVALDSAVIVGRAADCDLVVPNATVSRRHCRVVWDGRGRVTVTDLGTTNGTWVGGEQTTRAGTAAGLGEVVRVGAVVLRIEPPLGDDRPRGLDPLRHLTTSGTVPFNRPPRPGAPPPVAAVDVPPPPPTARERQPVNVAAFFAPVVLGAVMVVVLGSWRYAMFMALSPVLLLAATVSGRRRASRERRVDERAQREAYETFARELARAAEAMRQRSWEITPSVAEVLRRATQPSTRLWERRRCDDDALRLHAGIGAVPWQPPLATDVGGQHLAGDALAVLEQWAHVPRSPVTIDLADGGVVGVVGERAGAVAFARSLLVQACVHHGPADLLVAVATAVGHVGDWDWTHWVPHTADGRGGRRLAAGHDDGRALFSALRQRDGDDGTLLVVLDDPSLLHGRDADARAVLRGDAGPVAGIVLADATDQLPAVCDTVVEVGTSDGVARLTRPAERLVVDELLLAGLSPSRCRDAARRLAGLEDPEVPRAAATLPTRVDLLPLLPYRLDVAAAWDHAAGRLDLRTPIGTGPTGTVVLDLVEQGPHGLLGGTTGAGKSELLRSLVAGLAATHAPDHCTFVLVDFKGGAAFDACADLPHVVGLVTDLDEHLGRRALRCLEAELTHREQRLRAVGASDLAGWLRLPVDARGDPLPRLLVVIDEFATLRAELPEFVTSLVGIAQRGRSLGVHLVLGTQRPSGAVDDNVRANANLRMALRMTDERDSVDVVGVGDAAAIPPSLPGRGLLRTGPGAPTPLQTALVTGRSAAGGPRLRAGALRFGADDLPAVEEADECGGPDDLTRLVAACRAAAARRELVAPRTPWPAPLPTSVTPASLPAAVDVPVPLGLLDDPDRQRQVTVGWDPARGNLLVLGMVGSGTTTTLATLALAAAQRYPSDALHLHVLDLGRGELAPLAGLPHCGAVVVAREVERRARLQAWLLAEADRRRQLAHEQLATVPLHLVLVDGLATWLDELDTPATYGMFEAIQRLVVDAPQLRMAVVGTVTRHGAVRSAISSAIAQRLVHRLADGNDYAALGLRPAEVPDLPPGRALRPDGGLVQVARVDDVVAAVADVAATSPAAAVRPTGIATMPDALPWDRVRDEVAIGAGAWRLPVGLDAVTLRPAVLRLHPGDHALVLGPPVSGRTGLLRGLAALAAPHAAVVVVGSHEDGWREGVRLRPAPALGQVLAAARDADRPTLVLVDDAEVAPDPGPVLDSLAAAGAPVRLVAAARQDAVQSDYGHWLRRVARSRSGLFLHPTGDVPGDLLGVRVPRRPPIASRAGRGWLACAGESRFVQVVATRA